MIRSARELSALIGAVYEAGLDPAGVGWPAVLERLRPAVGGAQVVLGMERRPVSYAHLHYVGSDADSIARYLDYYWRLDPVIEPRLSSTPVGEVLFSDALISPRELGRTEFDADWLRPRGFGGGAGTVLVRHGSAEAVLFVARPRGRGPFPPEDVEALGLLLPHVTAAVRASLRLAEVGAAGDAACAVLDRCSQAILLVDGAAGVHLANHAGEALLRAADGLALEPARGPLGGALAGAARGRLRAATPATTVALRRAVAEAAALAAPPRARGEPDVPPPPAALALDRASGGPPLAALAVPLGPSGGTRAAWADALAADGAGAAGGPTVALFVSDTAAAAGDAGAFAGDRLRAAYRLTPAEAAVAVALAAGDGLAAVAAAQGVALATVRTQAQHVYRKTGVRGQAALARLVERLAQVR
jgi:DNA-binding CsgD family transcriptional regulator